MATHSPREQRDVVNTNLPYFKFMPERYLTGDIQMCSLATQGFYVNLLAKLWQKGGYLPDDAAMIARLMKVSKGTASTALAQLKQCSIIATTDDKQCYVEFLLEQFEELSETHRKKVEAGRKGGKVKRLRKTSTAKAQLKHSSSNKDKEEDKDKEGASRPQFTPPTPEQVAEYCDERANAVDPDRFVDFYAANGWMVGKNKMKDWKAVVRNWERSDNGKGGTRRPKRKAMSYSEFERLNNAKPTKQQGC